MSNRDMMSFAMLHFLLLVASAAADLRPRQSATVPDFVNKYAPLVYLDRNDPYLPSDIGAQLAHTTLDVNFTVLNIPPTSPLSLSTLNQFDNAFPSNYSCPDTSSCPLFLTSKDYVTLNLTWLYGVLPDPVTGETKGAKSCAIIVNDHGNGVVDAFYMYFYAFNLGLEVLNQILGNHVGDWEHSMVRFTNGTPTTIWYSQHDDGQIFTYDAVSKNGTRPVVYSAIGSHANFAVPGTHSRNIAGLIVNDYTSPGPIWDPTLSAYYYSYTPTSSNNGTFTPYDASTPTGWLYYLGKWGDKQYPDSDPRQINFLNLNVEWAYVDGPTGPIDKDLNRNGTCPGNANTCTTLTTLPATSGSSIPVTLTRTALTTATSGTATATTVTTGTSAPSSSGSSASAPSGTAKPSSASAFQLTVVHFSVIGFGLLLAFL